MHICQKNRIVAVCIFVFFFSILVLSITSLAYGPDREQFTNDNPANYVTFNSLSDNVAVGDERNFVRIRLANSTETFGDLVEIEPGNEYEVYIYYHNNAAEDLNSSGIGVAHGVKVCSAYPTTIKKGDKGMISGIITADNSNPESVWDEAYVTTSYHKLSLKYKSNSAIIHNSGLTNGSELPDALFTNEGTYIGFDDLDGIIPGCAEYSGHITYTLIAEKCSNTLSIILITACAIVLTLVLLLIYKHLFRRS